MNLKHKITVIAGSLVIAGTLLTGAAFANTADNAATTDAAAPATEAKVRAPKYDLDQAVADGKLTQAEAEVLKSVQALRLAAMEKLQADSKAIIDQAVAEGKLTQEQADSLQAQKGRHGFGKGGGKRGSQGRGFMKGGATESTTAPAPAN